MAEIRIDELPAALAADPAHALPAMLAGAASRLTVGQMLDLVRDGVSNDFDTLAKLAVGLAAALDRANHTGVETIKDSDLLIVDPADASKRLRLDAGGVAAGQTRVLAAPDYDGTLATLAGVEVLTGKTLTTPTLNGALAGSSLASQAEVAAGGVANKIVTPARQQFHMSGVKAWALVNNAGTILKSYNIASVTKSSTGKWSVAFGSAMDSANYVVLPAIGASTWLIAANSFLTSGFTIFCTDSTGTFIDPNFFMIAVFGVLAP